MAAARTVDERVNEAAFGIPSQKHKRSLPGQQRASYLRPRTAPEPAGIMSPRPPRAQACPIGRTPSCGLSLPVACLGTVTSAVTAWERQAKEVLVQRLRRSVVGCVVLALDGLIAVPVASAATRLGAASRPTAVISVPAYITTGPDGALWFTNLGNKTNRGSIGRITTSGKVTVYAGRGIDAPAGIALGPDGALWFTNSAGGSIGRITTSGKLSDFSATGIANPIGITRGPGGDLWFTDAYNPGSFGLISTGGNIIIHTSKYIDDPAGITIGPDGDVWVANAGTSATKGSIAQLTTNGRIRVYTNSGLDEPLGITVGPDKAIWFTNYGGNSIGRITTDGEGRVGPASTNRTRSRPGRTALFGSPTMAVTRSAGSRRAAASPTTPVRASTGPLGLRPDLIGLCGSPIPRTIRSGGSLRAARSPTTPGPSHSLERHGLW